MTRFEFTNLIENLAAYYGAKTPGSRTTDLWFDLVQNIPAEALPWIERKICQDQDSLPRNLPKAIRELFEAWLNAHPEKRAFVQDRNCPDCEGGWLTLCKTVPGYEVPLSFSAPCGRCKQVPSKHYATLSEALAEGYERVDLRRCFWNGESIHDMTRRIGTPVPPATVY